MKKIKTKINFVLVKIKNYDNKYNKTYISRLERYPLPKYLETIIWNIVN